MLYTGCEFCAHAVFDEVPYGSTAASYCSGCSIEDHLSDRDWEDVEDLGYCSQFIRPEPLKEACTW